MAANWFIFLSALAALIGLRFIVVPREEAQLLATFGEDYRQYHRQTRSLFPRLFVRRASRRAG
jgi:protein-S-isoprenylcysteine O-methyltransferase Ste14